MLCKKCGAQIDDNSLECEFCGENLVEASVVEEEIEQPAPVVEQRSTHEIFEENKQRRKIQTEKVIDEKQQQLTEINARRELKRKREQRKKVILIVVICAIVAAAAGIGAYLLRDGIKLGVVNVPSPTPVATSTPTPLPTSTPTPQVETPAPTDSNTVNNQSNTVVQPSNTAVVQAPAKTPAPANTSNVQSANKPSRKGTGVSSYKTATATSGVTTSKINSKLAVGGVVTFDNNTNKSIMSFEIDKKTYYAYVSEGSVSSQINGKYITLSAEPTEQTYNGSTIYDITSLTYYDADGYVIPDSGIRYLTKSELSNLSKKQLGIARNEIYARHGRAFKIKEYSDYFKSKSWYKENPKYNYSNEAANLNEIELKNVYLILSLEG